MLSKRYGDAEFESYLSKREAVRAQARLYDDQAVNGDLQVIYNFGEGMIEDQDIDVSDKEVVIKGLENTISLDFENPYADMTS